MLRKTFDQKEIAAALTTYLATQCKMHVIGKPVFDIKASDNDPRDATPASVSVTFEVALMTPANNKGGQDK